MRPDSCAPEQGRAFELGTDQQQAKIVAIDGTAEANVELLTGPQKAQRIARLRTFHASPELQERSCRHRCLITEALQAIHQRVSLLTEQWVQLKGKSFVAYFLWGFLRCAACSL